MWRLMECGPNKKTSGIGFLPESMSLQVCLEVVTRYLVGIPMHFLFWKSKGEN